MLVTAHLVLLIIGLVLLALAALGVPAQRFSFGFAGLFFWALSTAVTA